MLKNIIPYDKVEEDKINIEKCRFGYKIKYENEDGSRNLVVRCPIVSSRIKKTSENGYAREHISFECSDWDIKNIIKKKISFSDIKNIPDVIVMSCPNVFYLLYHGQLVKVPLESILDKYLYIMPIIDIKKVYMNDHDNGYIYSHAKCVIVFDILESIMQSIYKPIDVVIFEHHFNEDLYEYRQSKLSSFIHSLDMDKIDKMKYMASIASTSQNTSSINKISEKYKQLLKYNSIDGPNIEIKREYIDICKSIYGKSKISTTVDKIDNDSSSNITDLSSFDQMTKVNIKYKDNKKYSIFDTLRMKYPLVKCRGIHQYIDNDSNNNKRYLYTKASILKNKSDAVLALEILHKYISHGIYKYLRDNKSDYYDENNSDNNNNIINKMFDMENLKDPGVVGVSFYVDPIIDKKEGEVTQYFRIIDRNNNKFMYHKEGVFNNLSIDYLKDKTFECIPIIVVRGPVYPSKRIRCFVESMLITKIY